MGELDFVGCDRAAGSLDLRNQELILGLLKLNKRHKPDFVCLDRLADLRRRMFLANSCCHLNNSSLQVPA